MNTQFLKKQILTTETHSVWVGKKKSVMEVVINFSDYSYKIFYAQGNHKEKNL